MAVKKESVVTISFTVHTEDGVLVDEVPKTEPLDYLHGHENLIIGLEKALEGKDVGFQFDVLVEAKDAYGEHHEGLVQRAPAEVFGGLEEVEVGMQFIAETDIGQMPVEIVDIDGDEVVVDGNHMLAGQALRFTGEIMGIRDATEEEIAHGHLHDDGECCGGHDHEHDNDAGCCSSDNEKGCCDSEKNCCDDDHDGEKKGCCSETGTDKKGCCGGKKKKEKKGCCGSGKCKSSSSEAHD